MIRSASSPSSTKSSGCGSIRTSMPSRSKIGSSSSIERKNARSDSSARSGRPENSVLITLTPRSTVIWMTRFQLRTAASRASSSGPDQRSTGSTEAIPTPASAHALRNLGDQLVVGARVVEERDEVPMRGQLQVLVAQFRYHARELEQLVVVVERRGIQRDLQSGTHPSPQARHRRARRSPATGHPLRRPPRRRSRPTRVGPSTLTPDLTASTQRWISMS